MSGALHEKNISSIMVNDQNGTMMIYSDIHNYYLIAGDYLLINHNSGNKTYVIWNNIRWFKVFAKEDKNEGIWMGDREAVGDRKQESSVDQQDIGEAGTEDRFYQ